MFVSRLCTKAAAFSAAVIVSGFGIAHAAVPGGANVNIEGTVATEVVEAPNQQSSGLFFIEVTGTFFAQSLIEDPDALSQFALSASFEAGGRTFFDETLNTPTTSVNELLGFVGTDFDEVVAFGAPFVEALLDDPPPVGSFFLDDPIFGNFEGLEIGFAFENVGATENSIFGDFGVAAELTGDQLGEVQFVLQEIFGPINFEPEFDFAFNAAITPVPVPAALPMLLGGFAVFGFFGWRRKAVA